MKKQGTIETTYGVLDVSCSSRYSIYVTAGVDSADPGIVLSRVRYMLRLPLVRIDSAALSDKPLAAAEIAELSESDWRVTREALFHALRRKDGADRSHPTDAARREFRERLLPQIAAWLVTDDAVRLVDAADVADLARVADIADRQAEALRAAAAELDAHAQRARAGTLSEADRNAVTHGYRLAPR